MKFSYLAFPGILFTCIVSKNLPLLDWGLSLETKLTDKKMLTYVAFGYENEDFKVNVDLFSHQPFAFYTHAPSKRKNKCYNFYLVTKECSLDELISRFAAYNCLFPWLRVCFHDNYIFVEFFLIFIHSFCTLVQGSQSPSQSQFLTL